MSQLPSQPMSSPDSPRSRRRIVIWVGLAVVLLLAAGAGAYVLLSGGDVSNPDVEFRAEPTETPAPEPAKQGRGHVHLAALRLLADPPALPAGLEVAAAAVHAALVVERELAARVHARDRRGQAVRDQEQRRGLRDRQAHRQGPLARDLGKLAASAPAYANGRIYVTILARNGSKNGLVAALRAKDGARLWTKPLPSRTESSPLFAGGRIYFGSEDGTVYALQRQGRQRDAGATRPAARSRAALALADGKLYFGDYGGRVYAIRQSNGKRVWSSSTHGARFGTSSGQFYATPALAYGRVYIGNTDSNVYSFSASTRASSPGGPGRAATSTPRRGRAGAGRQADRLRRLLRRALLRARRQERQGALEAQGAGADLGRRDRGRRHRLLRRPAVAHHDRAGRAHRPQGRSASAAAASTRW